MTLNLRIAVRDWDYLTPLALGDVTSPRITVTLDRVATLPAGPGPQSGYDATEASFSRYLTGIEAHGQTSVGIANFLMRGFRHQCIIARKDSPLTEIEHLVGKRIGVTGWQDSGNTWTRAILRQSGIMTEDAFWYAGRLTQSHPVMDRLGRFGQPGLIEPAPGEAPLMQLLAEGGLDAVFTPFMPAGFFDRSSEFRLLLPDCVAAQKRYFDAVGYVPGIHLLTLDPEIAQRHPWVPDELSRLIDESRNVWTEKHRRYADTTPFTLTDLLSAALAFPPDWDASGFDANRRMIAGFATQMFDQNLLEAPIRPEDIFPQQTGPQQTGPEQTGAQEPDPSKIHQTERTP